MGTRSIAEGVFTPNPEPRLLAGRCLDCDAVTFPRQEGCPRCAGRSTADHQLPAVGLLWSWTVQRFRPKAPFRGPEHFEPYAVGYVEFTGECIVEGRLTCADAAQLRIGAPMRLTLIENHRDEHGDSVMTYAFAPEGGEA